ncbi:MAG: hypothetical protein B7Y36_08975 [Novosphingobium sp. 28-62-57]|uniref:RNA polymerase sigma factor n=1 Tax=unclassified Novosphingobium TaxID=2644732 RepID=UPI000BD0E22F|nr:MULTISPECIES: RNA polymerase sigma factor [unclassified Novosphingobium]OYW51265.1 MAG: hypothetical protein B7Z34_00155 [Novosphingobium sp. 12-62-10]OYZ10354.1 MAG: hypothetical protein B7Y36_08975 [Novosphingobium sp. 28-62-57]OZA37166.1 MAG: hypothetical protein B7X92_05175 [Novosphingobium sp. 17-62-9]HQS68074.1 RNA polymerase sigma factor [Novosphingobium sp.]
MTDETLRHQLIELIPRLRRFARVLTGNMSDADDVVQATLEKAMRNVDQWQNGTRLDSWVFAIARNAWIDDRRLARNRTQHDDITEMLDIAGDDGQAEVERRSTQRAVRAAVDQLPEEQRLVVGIVLLEGYSYREASEMLDIPIGTVMSRLSRAKAALAALLGPQGAAA